MRLLTLLVTTLLLGILAGCATPAKIHVDSISAPDADQTGKRFVLLSGDPAVRQQDLYFQEFREYFHRALERQGYQPSAEPGDAEQAIYLSYGLSDGKTSNYMYTTPVYDFIGGDTYTIEETVTDDTGAKTTTRSRIYIPPTSRMVGRDVHVGSYTTYTAFAILESRRVKGDKEGPPLWRTSAHISTESNDLRFLIQHLAAAMEPYIGRNTGRSIEVKLSK